jgi:light-regulated signal transduction histidine kinase (bacteriophytochrome)
MPDDQKGVLAPYPQLRLVFRNLIDNAIKYRAARRLKVRVTAQSHDDGWLFSVRDNGMGIKKYIKYTNENNWELIFGLFRRDHVKSLRKKRRIPEGRS